METSGAHSIWCACHTLFFTVQTLSEFCQKWRLVVNTKKTKVYVFRKDTVYSWNNTILEKTQSYKYLGVWFTRNGKFTKAKKHLADQAKKALLSTIARLHHPPIPIILQLYESTLKPIMFYGCEIWGFTENTDLEKVGCSSSKSYFIFRH